MGIFSKIFGGKKEEEKENGGMENLMTLIRVYFQASIAEQVGVSNLAMLPDLRMFKTTLHVPTVNNKLGVGEKKHCAKMMKDLFGFDDSFFKEIDGSIRKNCRKLQDVQTYLFQFQGFTQEIMMLTGNLMKLKLRLPSIFKNTLRQMTAKTVHDIFYSNNYSDAGVVKSVMAVRQYNQRLKFSEQWITEFVFNVVMLAKKEQPKNNDK